MKKLLGKNAQGVRVYGEYTRGGQSSLPTLTIRGRTWRGSSLGPTNAACSPNEEDVTYWQSIAKTAGLIE